jgi:hypothetical protein
VQAFGREVDEQITDALAHADLEVEGHLLLDRAEAAFATLEHEAMHQETLLYMWHRLPFAQKTRPAPHMDRHADDLAGATSEYLGQLLTVQNLRLLIEGGRGCPFR